MWFRLLGPLEAVCGEQPVALGGTKQRATLGFLLLQPNRVVATSQLLKALWAGDDAPTSARKILQNAVSGLRGALAPPSGADQGAASLLTRAPGYMLRVDPEQIDLHHFYQQVEAGRGRLAAGSPEAAAQLLREALALWRGPALADLVETGISWPELVGVQNARLDAMEDYFEAELACGRHHAVLSELETLVEAETMRERSCGQLMLALYRCGRQADALTVYGRVRAALVEDLGLEPGRDLQALQHAILTHDPALTLTELPAGDAYVIGSRGERTPPVPERVPARRGPVAPERKPVSAVIVRTQLRPEVSDLEPGHVDGLLEEVAAIIREKFEWFGGTAAASIGSVSLALFGVHGDSGDSGDDAERAVRAALAIRDGLGSPVGPLGMRGLDISAAVTTGEAIVRYQSADQPDLPPLVSGALLDECQSLLAVTAPGEIRVCASTRAATEPVIGYDEGGSPTGGWQVLGARREYARLHAIPMVDRESELEVLRVLLDRARRRATPHLVTVMGEPGIGKSRFLLEFERRFATQDTAQVQFLVCQRQFAGVGSVAAVQSEILSAYCGIAPEDDGVVAVAKLSSAVRRLVDCDETAAWLVSRLRPLVAGPGAIGGTTAPDEIVLAWRKLLAEIALDRPLVLILDDLHRADDALLDVVEELAEFAGPVPLLVVAAARPELIRRRPEWGGGKRHTTTITLDPLSDDAVDRLLELLSSAQDEAKGSTRRFWTALLARAGQEPGDRRRYARSLLHLDPPRSVPA
ncbi:BTAD domain-containing putative transcriptional regulator [Streptomyces sp. FH025]|uniref:BTAD domain-containing putative transcriptional regulator n=1 Tax=Streptomyces sp. FH025 TaxID=2815937 RepID=UPI001A9ED4B2|nr:BTAD domain-containing putative transcriptional regulator [Streptomyces sp. FH025]MBO1414581.1 AAA family ATPase [Streptomyces sp. FH025]